ncbi:nucleotidyltransferase family protein [Rhodoligotrophos defluvii]|uniref:nucleotidyltransferase family protein n=1 Tax=Rhodoligotrophos defluvii TaxID=2561934 RepID=UPI0010C9FA0B|nr:nucleotidyltransferase family protein [Rhodoligotrophos defluvii]
MNATSEPRAAAKYEVLVLAAGRGPDDPMAKAFGVSHKCAIPVGGVPMLVRVLNALRSCSQLGPVTVSVDRPEIAQALAAEAGAEIRITPSSRSAPASVIDTISRRAVGLPLLVTTADHPLLDQAMLDHFVEASASSGADITAGLATAETILAAYPASQRTFLDFAGDRVSGCNLFAVNTQAGLKALAFWDKLDQLRKKPLRLVGAFGVRPLLLYGLGRLTLDRAFAEASRRLGITARPVLMPYAEAAIDVDKPADKQLVEAILSKRARPLSS